MYSQTSVDIAFDGSNHEVQIETSDAQGEGVLSFAKNIKSNEFYPTYKYTAFFTTRNVKPENAIDENSVKFSSDSAAIESINAKPEYSQLRRMLRRILHLRLRQHTNM